MDSKIVSKQLRNEVRPFLRSEGFLRFTARSYWRHHENRIDVVKFQSLNSHSAEVIGCTTYSVSVSLGCYYLIIPPQYPTREIKMKDGLLCPEEYVCHFRGSLHKSLFQSELERGDIWYVAPDGSNLESVVADIAASVVNHGAQWFENISKQEDALRILEEDNEVMGKLWGFGRNPSPIRHYYTGYMALALGRKSVAYQHLKMALDSNCFGAVSGQLRDDILSLK